MKKILTKEIDICDFCKLEEVDVDEYYTIKPICANCNKIYCNKCEDKLIHYQVASEPPRITLDKITICPTCNHFLSLANDEHLADLKLYVTLQEKVQSKWIKK